MGGMGVTGGITAAMMGAGIITVDITTVDTPYQRGLLLRYRGLLSRIWLRLGRIRRIWLGLGYGFGPGYYGGWGYPGYYGGWGYPGYYGGYGGYGGYGYGAPYGYPPAVYIQRQEAPRQQKPANYWYYCRNPEGYYPYVKQCAAGWIPVPPEPSDQ